VVKSKVLRKPHGL